MTETYMMVALGAVQIFSGIVLVIAWSTLSRWILQVFEKMINIMDLGHFHERGYD